MTPRSVAIQGGLAFVALVAAYATWQRSPELQAGEVFVLDGTKNDLELVRFEDNEGKSWSELGKAKDADGTFVTLRMSGYDNTGMSMPAGHPGIPLKLPERLVRGNEAAGRMFERFAPLRAQRALGALDPGMLKELGLDTTKKFLEVTVRGVKRRFGIVPAPPGGSDPYLQDLQDKKVYLVARQILSDLQSASTNLVERRVHTFKIEDVDRVVVDMAGNKRTLVGQRIDDLPGIRVAPAESPDKPDPTLKNWNDKIFALFPTEVLGKDEVPASGAPVVVLRLDYSSRGRALGFTEIGRAPDAPASGVTTVTKPDIYVRSEYTMGWYRVSPDIGALVTEGEKVVGKK